MSVARAALVCSALPLLALFSWGSALAQSVSPTDPRPVSYPISTVRNVSTIGAGTVNPANVGRYAFATATGGLVVADAATGLPLPDGRTLPLSVRAHIPKATIAAAIGRFAVKSLPLLSAGAALYDLGEELGFGIDNTSGGAPVITKQTTTAGCATDPQALTTGYWGSLGAPTNAGTGGPTGIVIAYRDSPTTCRLTNAAVNPLSVQYHQWSSTTPDQVTNDPSSVDDLVDAINDKGTWSPSSPLARAFRDAILAGDMISRQPDSVTGPGSTPGPVSTTTDATNNTTTTSTTTHHHTYAGNQVSTTTTTTNVTVNNTTGATISSTTVTSQPSMPERAEEEAAPVDKALPAQPKLYTPKYPQGLVGVWNAKKSELDSAPLVQLLESLMPAVGSSGSCPSWMLPVDVGFASYGTYNVAPPCWVWDFGKVIIIISALLLARRLIFGG